MTQDEPAEPTMTERKAKKALRAAKRQDPDAPVIEFGLDIYDQDDATTPGDEL